ncbi:MAG: XrtA/PEP-CTERM system histidine kinase PrsK [Candidatus Eisenbacteria bacterium]
MSVEWSWHASPIQAAIVTASALLLAAIGLLVLLRRGHWLTTLLFASAFLSLAAFQAGVLGMVNASDALSARTWATYLARNSALVSWLWLTLSVVLGRAEPRTHIRNAGAYLALSLLGCVVLSAVAGTRTVVESVQGHGPAAVVVFGAIGKLYLIYLVVAMVAVLMNLESMLRTSPALAQERLRPLFLAILVAILAELLVVSAGLLYGGLRVSWLVTGAPVTFVAGSAAAMALAKRRLSDMSVPVARPVIYYSSVSLTLAGTFMLSMLVLSRVLPVLDREWRLGVTIAFLLFVGGGGLVLMLSPATSRRIRRFVDRNFYANRYDYRREWERVTSTLTPSARPEQVAAQVEKLVCDVFEVARVAIHVRDSAGHSLRRLHGGDGVAESLAASNVLVGRLEAQGWPVVFRELEEDLDLIPALVENRETIEGMGAAVAAPLAVEGTLFGVLWLSDKRAGEAWTLEDTEFLAAMSRQLAAALWFSRQAELMVEARQLESLNRLSSFVLHDIKNQVSGLSLVVDNARRHLGNPEFQRDAMAVVERTVKSLRELMSQVSSVSRTLHLQSAPCALSELVDDALAQAGLALGGAPGVRVTVELHETGEIVVDREQMTRVLVNLLVNAREAMDKGGEIAIVAAVTKDAGGEPMLELVVRDDGRGMTEEFVRSRLFRPFSTTKVNGLGIGLAQCRTIVEAHGGRILVRSRPEQGTTFTVRVPVGLGAARTETTSSGNSPA